MPFHVPRAIVVAPSIAGAPPRPVAGLPSAPIRGSGLWYER